LDIYILLIKIDPLYNQVHRITEFFPRISKKVQEIRLYNPTQISEK